MEAAAATVAAPHAGGAPPRLAGAGEVQPSARITAARQGGLGVSSGACYTLVQPSARIARQGGLGVLSGGRMLYTGAAISSYRQVWARWLWCTRLTPSISRQHVIVGMRHVIVCPESVCPPPGWMH